MRRTVAVLSASFVVLSAATAFAQNNTPRNFILFVPDGLRALKVTPETAPAMAEIRDKGVNFKNPHSLFRPSPWPTPPAWRRVTISRRHRNLQQHDLHQLPGWARRRHRGAVSGKTTRSWVTSMSTSAATI